MANSSSADDDDARSPRASRYHFIMSLNVANISADESGSGCMTILEAFRVLLTNQTIANGEASYTAEFHWYAENYDQPSSSSSIFNSYA